MADVTAVRWTIAGVYALLWFVIPQWLRGMWTLLAAVPVLALSASGTYAWALLLVFCVTDVLLALSARPEPRRFDEKAGLDVGAAGRKLLTFIRTVVPAKTPDELYMDDALFTADAFTQIAEYGSFIVWCILTFAFHSRRDSVASTMHVASLTIVVCVTLFQIPVHLLARSFYVDTLFRLGRVRVQMVSFPLSVLPILSVTLTGASLAVRWYTAGPAPLSVGPLVLFLVLSVLPLAVLPAVPGKHWWDLAGNKYWWELRRLTETVLWLALAAPPEDGNTDSIAEIALAGAGTGFAILHAIEFVALELTNKPVWTTLVNSSMPAKNQTPQRRV